MIVFSHLKSSIGYLMDPHTAVGKVVADRHSAGNDGTPMLISSTAHYGKFASDVLSSLGQEAGAGDEPGTLLRRLRGLGSRPDNHSALERSVRNEQVHKKVVDASLEAVSEEVENFVQERVR